MILFDAGYDSIAPPWGPVQPTACGGPDVATGHGLDAAPPEWWVEIPGLPILPPDGAAPRMSSGKEVLITAARGPTDPPST